MRISECDSVGRFGVGPSGGQQFTMSASLQELPVSGQDLNAAEREVGVVCDLPVVGPAGFSQ